MPRSLSLAPAFFFLACLALDASSAQAQCAPGLAAYPEGCCNGTMYAGCFSPDTLIELECASDSDPNQGCVWDDGNRFYTCGDTTTMPSADPSGTYPRQCSCTVDCGTRQCGTDGCGGTCGDCSENAYCGYDDATALDYQCVCDPDCTNKYCGDDGCGGSCGECTGTDVCNDPSIGCETCQPDCAGKICGPDGCGGTCDGGFPPCFAGEECSADGTQCVTCTPECSGKVCGGDGCGGNCGICDTYDECSSDGTQCIACVPQCTGATCGDDQCGGTCGTCGSGEVCTSGNCEVCTPDCTGKVCGTDGCGGSCGTCSSGTCTSEGQCDLFYCNDLPMEGCCDGSDYLVCGINLINIEDCAASGQVCGGDSGGFPGCMDLTDVVSSNECPARCQPQCTGKNCGDDGCGGVCGACDTAGGELCNADQVCEQCVPQCTGKVCGTDFCGGSCGTCTGEGEVCNADGQCEVPERTCANIPTGGCCEDGVYKHCDDGPQTQLRCSDFGDICGGNWFGGFAGCWPDDQYEGPKECACIPQCDGKTCGPDGCGGVCGECAPGQDCTDDQHCAYTFCPDLPDRRCCTGEVLSTCDLKRGPFELDCRARNQFCGWDLSLELYGCVDEPDSIAPSSLGEDGAPRACPDAPVCVPDCTDRVCGADGCGGSCGECALEDETCDFLTGTCVGETVCSELPPGGCCYTDAASGPIARRQLSCSSTDDFPSRLICAIGTDSTGRYGRQRCGWDANEGRVGCVVYSSLYGQEVPAAQPPADINIFCPTSMCIPDCSSNDQCGTDGCGGVCGVCGGENDECIVGDNGTGGRCVAPCVPSCNGRECGSDGCGGSCGQCETYYQECREYDTGESGCVVVNRCGDLEPEGCCRDAQRVKRCDEGLSRPVTEHCGVGFCGWNADEQAYGCGRYNGEADPSGEHPRACPSAPDVCQPVCYLRQCGADGCGGSCGSCPGGTSCSITGECLPVQCFEPPGEWTVWSTTSAGCCTDDDQAAVCGSTSWRHYGDNGQVRPGAKMQIELSDCGDLGCGWNAVWQQYRCNEAGKDPLPLEDPAGTNPRQCAEPVCTPDCKDNVCGLNDGCGGSCGTCEGNDLCVSGQCESQCLAQHTQSGKAYKVEGRCSYSVLYTCEDGLPLDQDCSELGGGFCGWNEALGAYSCGTDGRAGPAGSEPLTNIDCNFPDGLCGRRAGCPASAGACPSGSTCSVLGEVINEGFGTCLPNEDLSPESCKARCGGTRASGQCSCSPSCTIAGDCCADYAYECEEAPSRASCGDGFCHKDAGESCATCEADCGACPAGSNAAPPWNMPYARAATQTAGGSLNQLIISPLDDVLPSAPPVPTAELLLHLPAARIDHARPGARARWDLDTNPLDDPGPLSAPGRVGQGMRFWEERGGAPRHLPGELTWTPDGDLPRTVDTRAQEPGGMSVAMWVKVPEDLDERTINTLWNGHIAPDASASGERVCLSPRAQSRSLVLRCPTLGGQPSTVRHIRMVAGELSGLPASPDGTCRPLSDHLQDGACLWQGADAFARQRCEGRSQCTITLPEALPGCEGVSDASFYVDAVCSTASTDPIKTVSLLVLPSAEGSRLVLSTPTETLRSAAPVEPGRWHHVGFTFQPYAPDRQRPTGMASLFLDGTVSDTKIAVTIPRILYTSTAAPPKEALSLPDDLLASTPLERVELVADLDEVLVYGRALSDQQMSGIARNGARGLRMAWPKRGAGRRMVDTPDGLSLVPVEADHLIDPGAPGGSRPLRREEPALRVAQAQPLVLGGEEAHDLGGLTSYTLAAWVRKPSAATTSTLLKASQGGDRLTLDLAPGTCGGRAVTATVGGQALAQTSCAHGVDRDRWAFVAITQDGTRRRVFVDAVLVAEAAVSAPAALFASDGGAPGIELSDVDVFWVGLFERALDQQALVLWRGQGPALWTDGAVYVAGAQSRLRDYARYEERGDAVLVPYLTNASGVVLNRSGQGPLTLSKATSEQLVVPANVHFPKAVGTEAVNPAPRVFSVAARVAYAGAGTYPLLDLRDARGGVERTVFRADVECTAAVSCRVRGRGLVTGPDVAGGDELRFVSELFALGGAADEVDVALSFDGRHVYAAMGAMGTAGVELSAAKRIDITEALQTRDLPSTTSSAVGSYFVVSPLRATGEALELRDLRLYPRPISPVEALALSRRDCNDSGCDARGRTCQAGAGAALPACATCERGGTAVSPEMGSMCVAAVPFLGACDSDLDCQTGLCANQRCLARGASAACKQACGALGRSCEDKGNGGFGCSYTCQPNYQDLTGTDTAVCTWSPPKKPGELCSADTDCSSGACRSANEPSYQVSEVNTCPTAGARSDDATRTRCRQPAENSSYWKVGGENAFCVSQAGPNDGTMDPLSNLYDGRAECPPVFPTLADTPVARARCMHLDSLGCKKQNRQATAGRATPPGQDEELNVYQCGGCIDTKYNGTPLYVQGFKLLKPQLCRTIRDRYTQSWIDEAKDIYYQGIGISAGADVEFLKRTLLNRTGPVTPKDLADLDKMGVGPNALSPTYAKEKYYHRAPTGLSLWQCANPIIHSYYAWKPNALFDPDENGVMCKPNRFPNGTQCPPPGYNAEAGDSPHAFCESGFCARDTGVCENGNGFIEDNAGEDRADEKDGESSDFPVHVTQRNNTSMHIRQVGTLENGTTRKRRVQLSSLNENTLSFFGRSRSVMRIEQTMTSNPEDAKASFTGKTFLLGVEVPTGSPASECGSFVNGEYVAPAGGTCAAPVLSGNLAPQPPAVTVCLPSPGACKDKDPYACTPNCTTGKGPMCLQKTTFIGPIPIKLQAEVTLDTCVGIGTYIDSQTYEPAFQVIPSVGVGIDLRGGVGGSAGPIEAFAGVRAGITILQLEFPISWGIRIVKSPTDPSGQSIENLYVARFQRSVTFKATLLKLVLSLFAEVGISIFKISWEQIIFQFGGLTFQVNLATSDIDSRKVDFEHPAAVFNQ